MALDITVADVIAHLSQFPLDTKVTAFPPECPVGPGHLHFLTPNWTEGAEGLTVAVCSKPAMLDGCEVKKKCFVPTAWAAFEAAFPSNCKEMTPFMPEQSIKNLVEADMWNEAHHLDVYRAAWERTTKAYHSALASLDDKALSQLHVVTYTIEAWGPLFLGTEVPNRERSIKERAADEEWHRRNSGPFS